MCMFRILLLKVSAWVWLQVLATLLPLFHLLFDTSRQLVDLTFPIYRLDVSDALQMHNIFKSYLFEYQGRI